MLMTRARNIFAGKLCLYWVKYLFGGGGGSRTRVRKSSTLGSTCLVSSFCLIVNTPTDRIANYEPENLTAMAQASITAILLNMTR